MFLRRLALTRLALLSTADAPATAFVWSPA
jgi:hypothetical protein